MRNKAKAIWTRDLEVDQLHKENNQFCQSLVEKDPTTSSSVFEVLVYFQITGESLRPCGKYFQGNRIYGDQSGCPACSRIQEIRPA